MKFVSISELKQDTSGVVREVKRNGPVVVVRHGKPCAAVIRISPDELDQLLFEDSALVKQAVEEALDDMRHKRHVTLKDYLRGKRSP
ncbi:MAG: type II toxin-antitoxin system Phd/YefM family antitoxin [Candidatus Omnitrophota bacterium]|nr:type II toxin-antitoxin system Phd/YefM family antitoxin [Candidatus Omnitrophota bacterium]